MRRWAADGRRQAMGSGGERTHAERSLAECRACAAGRHGEFRDGERGYEWRWRSGRSCLMAAGFVLGEHSRIGAFIRGAVLGQSRIPIADLGVSIADPRFGRWPAPAQRRVVRLSSMAGIQAIAVIVDNSWLA